MDIILKNYYFASNNKKIISALLLPLFLLLNCTTNNYDNINHKNILLISEPLPNRTKGYEKNLIHDKNCLGFYHKHFSPKIITPAHFQKNSIFDLISASKLNWQFYFTKDSVINLTHLFSGAKNKVIYIAEIIEADSACKQILSFGSDDGIMIWVNGDSIITVHRGRAVKRNDDFVQVSLQKGKNIFLYKIDQGDGDWGLYRRLITEKALDLFYKQNAVMVYSDIPESCIIPDTAKYLPLKINSKRKLDKIHNIRIKWKTLDQNIINIETYQPSMLGGMIKLPDSFDGKALCEIAAVDAEGNINYEEEFPVFYQKTADVLQKKLIKIKSSDPAGMARKETAIKMWNSNGEREYSTRMKAQALIDLYRWHNSSRDKLPLYKGPQVWGYRSKVDNTIQPYRVFIPALYNKDRSYPVTFVTHGLIDKDLDFWESDEGGSHYHTTWRTALSTENQRILVMPHGRGNQNYLKNAVEELPIIVKQLQKNWNIDTTRISIFAWSKGARNILQLMLSKTIPIETMAIGVPVIIEDETKLYSLLLRIKDKYPDLKWYIRHGMNDSVAPVHHSRKFVSYLKKMSFHVNYEEMPHSNHFSHLIDPEREFYIGERRAESVKSKTQK